MSSHPSKRPGPPTISGYSSAPGNTGVRPGLILGILLVVVAGVVGVVFTFRGEPKAEVAVSAEPASTTASASSSPASAPSPTSDFRPARPTFGTGLSAPRTDSPVVTPVRQAAPAPVETLPRTAATVQAAGIIDQMMAWGASPNAAITPEQSAQIADQMRQIIDLGPPALAAIQDFLQKNVDLAFGKPVKDGGTGAFSMRTGLLQALGSIGGPEAVTVAAGVLQNTTLPGEIGLLTQTLEQLAPGEYREASLAASREALRTAVTNPDKNNEQEMAALFQVMQTLGDPAVAGELKNLSNQWRYYSLIALAGLPENQGVPALIEMATGPGAQAAGYQQIASRMLAQSAPTNPDAQKVLLEQAQAGQIVNWGEVASALSGSRLDFAQRLFGAFDPAAEAKITQTHHVVHGNQNFRTVQSEIPAAQIPQHTAFIDQMLSVTVDPVGRAELLKAREALTGGAN